MKKLIKGILDFRRTRRDAVKDTFAQLALGQSPDTFFIACSDSRMAVNVFASTDPGDLFVHRNVGNLIPPEEGEGSEASLASLEFALSALNVKHLVVCGHSDCGAMKALVAGREALAEPHLKQWLRHGEAALEKSRQGEDTAHWAEHDAVSRANVVLQMEHLASHHLAAKRIEAGQLAVHGIWFDIRHADIYYYEKDPGQFVLLDGEEGERVLRRLDA